MRLADHYFFSSACDGRHYRFDAEEARHAYKVMRLRVGDGLRWLDGRGGRFAGRLQEVSTGGMIAVAEETRREAAPQPLELGVGALHDATRLEWLCEKSVELGATAISVLTTHRVERSRYRLRRLHAKALAAMKQSGRSYLPTIIEESLDDYVRRVRQPTRLLAHCDAERRRTPLLSIGRERLASGCNLLIGPEGDFTRGEIELAVEAGWQEVTLGAARLRTETAALAMLAAVAASRTLSPDQTR